MHRRRADPRRWARRATSLAGLAGLLLSGVAHADGLPVAYLSNYGEQDTPRAAAVGGAVRALSGTSNAHGSDVSAALVNPANLGLQRYYHIQAIGQITPEVGRQLYGGAIVDSITGRLAGGLSFVGGWVNGEDHSLDRSEIDVRGSLSMPLGDSFFIGVAGRYLKAAQAGIGGPLGDSLVSGGLAETPGDRSSRSAFLNTFTFDAGLTIRATKSLHLSLLGQNLTYPDNGLLPTTVGAGIGYATPDFTVELDGVADFTSYDDVAARFMLGGEYLTGRHFPLRLGYRYDQGANKHEASGGFGYLGSQFGIEAAVRRTLDDPGLTTVVFSLSYFVESSGLTRSSGDDL